MGFCDVCCLIKSFKDGIVGFGFQLPGYQCIVGDHDGSGCGDDGGCDDDFDTA
ncbi:hypothetical protein glysoja_005306 [Glycine soja]|nr:hypothetical protein glysoja_005306 [Glycine soja]